MLWLSYHCTMAYFYFHDFNRNNHFLSYIKIAIVRILNLRRMTCRMLQIFFLFLFFACLWEMKRNNDMWGVRDSLQIGLDQQQIEPVSKHWPQRKRTDSLTTHGKEKTTTTKKKTKTNKQTKENPVFVFSFFTNAPSLPKNKVLIWWVVGWSLEEVDRVRGKGLVIFTVILWWKNRRKTASQLMIHLCG